MSRKWLLKQNLKEQKEKREKFGSPIKSSTNGLLSAAIPKRSGHLKKEESPRIHHAHRSDKTAGQSGNVASEPYDNFGGR